MHGDMRDGLLRLANHANRRPHAILQLADLANHGLAIADDVCGFEARVYDADVGALFHLKVMLGCGGVEGIVRLAADVQRDVLLSYQTRADAGAEVLVQKSGDFERGDVFAGFEEAAGEDGDGVVVGLDEVGHNGREGDLVFESFDAARGVGEEGAEAVDIVAVDLADVRVGDDDVGEAAEGLYAMGQASGEEGEGEVGAVEEGLFGERGVAMFAQVGEGEGVEWL